MSSSASRAPCVFCGHEALPRSEFLVVVPMPIANVQSLPPKISEPIALIQEENFDVIELNETWLYTQNKHLLQKSPYMVTRFITWTNQLQHEGRWINYVCQKHIEPNRKKISHLHKGGINPKNAVHIKLVLIYRNTRITAADDEFYTMLEEISLSQHECVIMGDFDLPNIDWTLERPRQAPGNKLMQLLADNNLTQHVHETTRQNNVLELVIPTDEELIVNLKIIDKIGDHQ